MLTIIKRELRDLKKRQARLEGALFALLQKDPHEYEEIRPEYLKKLERITKDMDKGNGVTVLHNRKELREFFRTL